MILKKAIGATIIEICLLVGTYAFPFCEIRNASTGEVYKSFWMQDTDYGSIIIGGITAAFLLVSWAAEKFHKVSISCNLNRACIIGFIISIIYIIINFADWKEVYNVSIQDGRIIDGGIGLICFGLAFLVELFRRHLWHKRIRLARNHEK